MFLRDAEVAAAAVAAVFLLMRDDDCDGFSTFDRAEILRLVNACRDDAGVPRVTWDDDIARGCREHVARGGFAHSAGVGEYAEVLAQTPPGYVGAHAYEYALRVTYWGERDEFRKRGASCDAPGGEGGCGPVAGFVGQATWSAPGCGHYCALVDPSLRKMGAAHAACGRGAAGVCKPGNGLACIRLV